MADKTKILIIEKNIPRAMTMVYLLTCAGCDVRVAPTGQRGMDLVQENRFDLIILDVESPGVSGFEIYCKLKQSRFSCETPVVLVARSSSLEDQQHALDVGAADYITEPFNGEEFVERLLSHVGRSDKCLVSY